MTSPDIFLTREDMLRELELLPVWRLREALPAEPKPGNSTPDLALIQSSEPETINIDATEITQGSSAVLVFSADKNLAFVLPAVLAGQSLDLFNSILRALKIKPMDAKQTQQLTREIQESGAKVVVVMGETVAQLLLTESVENLRGKLHTINGVPSVVTYHPDELLQHLPNKAKTWDDLCMALDALNA
jgi:uracil-DNA glycosylase